MLRLSLLFVAAHIFVVQTGEIHKLALALDALERIANYYRTHPASLNEDGLYGLRIAQGGIMQTLHTTTSLPPDDFLNLLNNRLVRILHHLTTSADQTYSKLAATDYFEGFHKLTQDPFILDVYHNTSLEESLPIRMNTPATRYSENHGDMCYKKIMGTYKPKERPCFIDRDCFLYMTRSSQNKYSLTHQLLYIIIADKMGCLLEYDIAAWPNTHETLQRRYCQDILSENDAIFKDGFSNHSFDLFVEQALLCSMIGYTNFTDNQRLDVILSLQDKTHGCYKWEDRHRSRRREKMDEDGCLAHTTGLVAGYLAAFIRSHIHPF